MAPHEPRAHDDPDHGDDRQDPAARMPDDTGHEPPEGGEADEREVEMGLAVGPGAATSFLLLLAVGVCSWTIDDDSGSWAPIFVALAAASVVQLGVLFRRGYTLRFDQGEPGFRLRTLLTACAAGLAFAELAGHGRTWGAAAAFVATLAAAYAGSRLAERRAGHVPAPQVDLVEVHH